MSLPERPGSAIAWELRGHWIAGRTVRLTLTDRCLIQTVIGRVRRVAVTGAFVVVDGWQIPTDDILAVGHPTVAEKDAYRQAKEQRDGDEGQAEAARGQ